MKQHDQEALDLLVDLYQAATGRALSSTELLRTAERLVNLERLIDAREGLTREHDRLPKRFFKPLAGGVHDGKSLDPEKMEQMKSVYYHSRGWDPETGLPTTEKLMELGLETLTVEDGRSEEPTGAVGTEPSGVGEIRQT